MSDVLEQFIVVISKVEDPRYEDHKMLMGEFTQPIVEMAWGVYQVLAANGEGAAPRKAYNDWKKIEGRENENSLAIFTDYVDALLADEVTQALSVWKVGNVSTVMIAKTRMFILSGICAMKGFFDD